MWLVDQSNSNGRTYGGAIHISNGRDLEKVGSRTSPAVEVIDLSGATTALCLSATGAAPVRPHMIVFNKANTHAATNTFTYAPADAVDLG